MIISEKRIGSKNAKKIVTRAWGGNQCTWLQSYSTVVAVYDEGTNSLYITDTKYSNTTTRHVNSFVQDFVGSKKITVPANELAASFRRNEFAPESVN